MFYCLIFETSLFVASNDSHGYGGSSRPRRHTGSVSQSVSQSESELLYDWRFTANQFFLATSLLRLTTSNFIFQPNTCGFSPYVTSSVYPLKLLLVLASAIIQGPSSAGLMTIFYCLRLEYSPNLEGQVAVFISPRNRVARLYPPGTGFPFRRLLRLAGLRF
jgi:hypothetical protein